MKTLVYLAHPLRGDVSGNLLRAKAWVRAIEEHCPHVAIVATWLYEVEIWDDSDEQQRADGIERNCSVIAACNQLWLVGPHISNGMAQEAEAARKCGVVVHDLTGVNADPTIKAHAELLSAFWISQAMMRPFNQLTPLPQPEPNTPLDFAFDQNTSLDKTPIEHSKRIRRVINEPIEGHPFGCLCDLCSANGGSEL